MMMPPRKETPMPRALALSALTFSLLAGCQVATPTAQAPAAVADAVILKGRVEGARRLLAVSADLVSQSTVSLVDAAGVTRAAGVTDGTGAFTLYQSTTPFTPTDGEAFTLQAMKRVDSDNGARWLSLRTEVLRENGAWRSISGPDVVISMVTTAIAKIDASDDTIAPTDVMGKLAGASVTAFADHTPAEVQAYAAALEALIPTGADPGGPLVWHGDVEITDQESVERMLPYDVIEGSLSLSPASGDVVVELPHLTRVSTYVSASQDFTGFAGLRGLKRVGAIELSSGGQFGDFRGLERLTAIDGALDVRSNTTLSSLAGLENLASCGVVRFVHTEALTDISALGRLTRLDELIVNGCASLTSLHGLESLSAVTGDVRIGKDVWVFLDGPESGLTSLAGLDNLASIGGALKVSNNQDMWSYDGGQGTGGGLRALQSVGGTVEALNNGTALSEGPRPADCTTLGELWASFGPN